LPVTYYLTADRMSLVSPPSSNGWTIPLNGDSEGHFGAKQFTTSRRDVVNFKHHFWRGICKINPVL
jgi:hypothetical protein